MRAIEFGSNFLNSIIARGGSTSDFNGSGSERNFLLPVDSRLLSSRFIHIEIMSSMYCGPSIAIGNIFGFQKANCLQLNSEREPRIEE
jgi:hypothetical protein